MAAAPGAARSATVTERGSKHSMWALGAGEPRPTLGTLDATLASASMRSLRAFAILCVVCTSGALLPSGASAQRNRWIGEARRLGAEADFEAALQAFERAQRDGGLTRQDVVELLAQRSIIYSALRDERSMQLDLGRLAALDP